jgi:hypothetical protein
MKCSQCDNKVTMIGATTCSLKCSCDAVGDDFTMVMVRVSTEVKRMMAPCKRGNRAKA